MDTHESGRSEDTPFNPREALQELVGRPLWKASSLCATRVFHFGHADTPNVSADDEYRLVVECPWRLEQAGRIVTGQQDYIVAAESNDDPAWTSGDAGGDLQNQKLAAALGAVEHGELIARAPSPTVVSVEVDAMGDMQVVLDQGYRLALFPSTAGEMEWMLRRPVGGSVIWMRGAAYLTSAKRIKP